MIGSETPRFTIWDDAWTESGGNFMESGTNFGENDDDWMILLILDWLTLTLTVAFVALIVFELFFKKCPDCLPVAKSTRKKPPYLFLFFLCTPPSRAPSGAGSFCLMHVLFLSPPGGESRRDRFSCLDLAISCNYSCPIAGNYICELWINFTSLHFTLSLSLFSPSLSSTIFSFIFPWDHHSLSCVGS